jgi:hypothetical protein
MGILTRAGDLVYTLRFLRLLTMSFENTDAYKLKIIDKEGNRTRLPLTTPELKAAYTPFHRIVFNIRRLLSKVPGGASTIANLGAALWLIHEKYGVNVDKVLKEAKLDKGLFLSESSEWFVINGNMLSPGTYKIKEDKMVNTTGDMLARKFNTIRVMEDCYPVGKIGELDIYEAVHINSQQPIYVTIPELLK